MKEKEMQWEWDKFSKRFACIKFEMKLSTLLSGCHKKEMVD